MIQTWVPLPSFKDSVKSLSDKDLGMQRYYVLEIMEYLHEVTPENSQLNENYERQVKHPDFLKVVHMWQGYEAQLCEYGLEACDEFAARGFAVWDEPVNLYQALTNHLEWSSGEEADFNKPDWFSDVDVHISHQAALVRNDPDHYSRLFKVDQKTPLVWPVSKYAKKD